MTIKAIDVWIWIKARIIAIGIISGSLATTAGAIAYFNPNLATESFVAQAQEETLKKVDDRLQQTDDVQIQLGNKIYGDTIRGLNRELRQIKREQKQFGNDIPQDLIDDEENIIEEIQEEQAILDEIKAKIKKRIE